MKINNIKANNIKTNHIKTKSIAVIISTILILFCLAGCAQSGTEQSVESNSSGAIESNEASDSVTAESSSATEIISLSANVSDSDRNAAWDESATIITLRESTASVIGSGATVSGSTVTIAKEGTYVISGTLTDGQIAIAATSNDKVHLVLNGVDITNKSGAPLYASQCDKLIITLADGTENTLTDGGTNFIYADTTNKEPNAALFCKDDLTINGTGSLTVNAGFNNGIGTKDDLLIVSGDITINAANHGLRGNDSITVLDGSFNITAQNDGIQTNNTEDALLGWVLIENGTFEITSAHDGIQADTMLTIAGGEFNIITGGQDVSADTTSDSYKGMKSAGNILITGGSFIIESADDAVHADGNIAIDGGNLTLSSGDDAVHADGDLTITGSATSIDILTSYEGLEAKTMTIADGIITLFAADDGINIAGGNDTSGEGRFGRDSFNSANSDQWLKITGGTITVIAGRDGIDINGSGEMTGGDVRITAATLGEGDTIDSDSGFARTGGSLTESGGNSIGGGMGGRGGRK